MNLTKPINKALGGFRSPSPELKIKESKNLFPIKIPSDEFNEAEASKFEENINKRKETFILYIDKKVDEKTIIEDFKLASIHENILLKYKEIISSKGDNLLHFSAKEGYKKLLLLLNRLKAPIYSMSYETNLEGKKPLYYALKNNDAQMVQFYLSQIDFHGIYVDDIKEWGVIDVVNNMKDEGIDVISIEALLKEFGYNHK